MIYVPHANACFELFSRRHVPHKTNHDYVFVEEICSSQKSCFVSHAHPASSETIRASAPIIGMVPSDFKHFGIPGTCLYLSAQITSFWRWRSRRQAGVFFRTVLRACSWKSKMKNVVKSCVYLDILRMGSTYVIKSTFLRASPILGQQNL